MKRFTRFIFDWRPATAVFILIPVVSVLLKIFYYDYDLKSIIPDQGYNLNLEIDISTDTPKYLTVDTFAPVNDNRQNIIKEEGVSENSSFHLEEVGGNRYMSWKSAKVDGQTRMAYTARIKTLPVKYTFDRETQIKTDFPEDMNMYLVSSGNIQVDSKVIRKKFEAITRDAPTIYDKLEAIHDFVVNDIKYVNFAGGLDAESTLLLMEASCNGKSRIYVTMVRMLGLPSRLIGGIILNESPKKITHQWVEIFINGQWVPFCPTNDHFASLPKHYVTLYYGDKSLFTRTSGIDFNYSYSFDHVKIPKADLVQTFAELPLNIFAFMEHFEKFRMSMDTFVYLLMLPFAALISVILKNIMGLETFGTFLPILIASVLGGTGVFTGIGIFFAVVLLVYFINAYITKLEILYHPKMAILLSFVIIAFLLLFYAGVQFKNYSLVKVVYFPVAIMAITINRVLIYVEEGDTKRLGVVSVNTVVVMMAAYYFINSAFLQLMMLSFPELIFLFIGLLIWVGRWAGFRMSEYFRFVQFFKKEV